MLGIWDIGEKIFSYICIFLVGFDVRYFFKWIEIFLVICYKISLCISNLIYMCGESLVVFCMVLGVFVIL